MQRVTNDINSIVVNQLIHHVCIEEPFVVHSPTGHAVALSGSLPKLFYMVGSVVGSIYISAGICVETIRVLDWKGQLPKQLTTQRVNRTYKLKLDWRTKQHNIADAIAMGHWYLHEKPGAQ